MPAMTRRRLFAAGSGLLLGVPAVPAPASAPNSAPNSAQGRNVVVFAAVSMKTALDEINAAWGRESGKRATISYAASSALAKQIESGAPADLFASADLDWMDYAAGKGLIRPDTRVTLLGNRLVLISQLEADAPVVTVSPLGSDRPLRTFPGAGSGAVWLSERWVAFVGRDGLVLYDAVDDRVVPSGVPGVVRLAWQPA